MLAEEPIVLPQLRASVQLPVPPQPEEPPTDQDLVTARSYYNCVRVLRDEGGLSDNKRPSQQEVADADRYLDNVKERVRAARTFNSGWPTLHSLQLLAAVITGGDPLQQVLREVREFRADVMRRLEEGLTDMSRRLDSVARAQTYP